MTDQANDQATDQETVEVYIGGEWKEKQIRQETPHGDKGKFVKLGNAYFPLSMIKEYDYDGDTLVKDKMNM